MTKLSSLEHQKTDQQRAEDVAYTINHAVSCATTDIFIVPTIAALPSLYGPRKQNFDWGMYTRELSGYMRGEIIGDFTAVPLTILTQRCFPGFMDMVGRMVDPLAKPLFRHGARTAAERWGKHRGLEATHHEVIDRAEQIYQHEMQHLPQAIVWNLFSFPLGVLGQKWTGHEGGWGHIAKSKLLGTAISNVLLIGARAFLPDKAERFDQLDGQYVIRPVTRAISGIFGIDRATMDRMDQHTAEAERQEGMRWRSRVTKPTDGQANAASLRGPH